MTKRYKNRFDRAMNDENWGDGNYEEVEYIDDVPTRFRRNKIDGVWGGVCAGIGDYTGLDPVIVRVGFVASFFLLLGPVIFLIYFGMWMFVPVDKRAPYRREYREYREAKRDRKRARSYQKSAGSRRYEEPAGAAAVRTSSFRDVKSKFRSLETRLADLERSVTSSEWQLRRNFRDLEN